MFLREFFNVEFIYGENGYLQILLEAGGVGLALLLSGIALSGWWLAKSLSLVADSRRGSLVGALLASFVASTSQPVWR